MESEQPTWSCSVVNPQALTSEHYQLRDSEGNLPDSHFSFAPLFLLGIPTDYTPMPLRRRLAVLLAKAVVVFYDLAVGQLQLKEVEGNFRIKFYKAKKDLTGSNRPLCWALIRSLFEASKGACFADPSKVLGFRAVCSKRPLAVRGILSGTSIL